MKRIFYTLVLFTILISFAAHSKKILIGYPEFKPYTYTEDGVAKGLGVEVFSTIAKKLQLDYQLLPIETHGNGFTRLKRGKLDAVMLATQNEERDTHAKFSAPIAQNVWSWFFIANDKTDYQALIANKDIKVASITNTNTHKWLIKNNYKSVSTTIDITAMLRQIDRSRIDAIFIAEYVLKHKLNALNLNVEAFHIHRQLTKPFGIYVSHDFLKTRPGFMTELDKEILKQPKPKDHM